MEALRRTPEGRAALAGAPAGWTLRAAPAAGGVYGSYNPATNSIALASGLSNEEAANFLVHELTHANQYQCQGRIPQRLWGQPIASYPWLQQQEILGMEHEAYDAQYRDWVTRGRPDGFAAPTLRAREQAGERRFNAALDDSYRRLYNFRR